MKKNNDINIFISLFRFVAIIFDFGVPVFLLFQLINESLNEDILFKALIGLIVIIGNYGVIIQIPKKQQDKIDYLYKYISKKGE